MAEKRYVLESDERWWASRACPYPSEGELEELDRSIKEWCAGQLSLLALPERSRILAVSAASRYILETSDHFWVDKQLRDEFCAWFKEWRAGKRLVLFVPLECRLVEWQAESQQVMGGIPGLSGQRPKPEAPRSVTFEKGHAPRPAPVAVADQSQKINFREFT